MRFEILRCFRGLEQVYAIYCERTTGTKIAKARKNSRAVVPIYAPYLWNTAKQDFSLIALIYYALKHPLPKTVTYCSYFNNFIKNFVNNEYSQPVSSNSLELCKYILAMFEDLSKYPDITPPANDKVAAKLQKRLVMELKHSHDKDALIFLLSYSALPHKIKIQALRLFSDRMSSQASCITNTIVQRELTSIMYFSAYPYFRAIRLLLDYKDLLLLKLEQQITILFVYSHMSCVFNIHLFNFDLNSPKLKQLLLPINIAYPDWAQCICQNIEVIVREVTAKHTRRDIH